jgi:hypothetical protein
MVFPFGILLVRAVVGVSVGAAVDVAVVTLVEMLVGVLDAEGAVGEALIPTTGLLPPLFTCRPTSTPPITRAMTSRIPMKRSRGCTPGRDGRRDPGLVTGAVKEAGGNASEEESALCRMLSEFISYLAARDVSIA